MRTHIKQKWSIYYIIKATLGMSTYFETFHMGVIYMNSYWIK